MTLKTKDREDEAVSSANTSQFHVCVINKLRIEWTKKVGMSLRLLNGLQGKKTPQFCCLKVIEFLIDFSEFYFKSIKPGRIA